MHISTGNIFRENIEKGTPLGQEVARIINQGALVPDALTNEVMREALTNARGGILLDGYPRTMPQLLYLDEHLQGGVDRVLVLNVPAESLRERVRGRQEKEGRKDDALDTFEERMRVYEREVVPVIEEYKNRGVVREVDGNRGIMDVWASVRQALQG